MIDRLIVEFDDSHRELDQKVARIARERVDAIASEGGEEDFLARRYVAMLADSGLLRYVVPSTDADTGKTRFDARALCIIRENLARSSGFADCMFAMQGLGSAPISFAGTNPLRQRHLPDVVAGKAITAFALTEPEAGSDVASMQSTAVRDGDDYVLNGTKVFISNAGVADLYVVFAKTDPDGGHRGISAFVVEADRPGFRVVERQRVIAPHPIGRIQFDNCRVPASSRLGDEGEGFRVAMMTLDVFRPTVGAAALGLARRALAEALTRAKERVQFGEPIAKFQAIQFHLAEMATELDAARLLVYRAVSVMERTGGPVTRESSMAKLYATEAAQRVVDKAVQIFGGAGVLEGSIVERLYREVRALRIYEGTSEIQHVVIATRLLKDENHGY